MCVYVLISQYLQSLKDEKETKLANRKERKKNVRGFFFRLKTEPKQFFAPVFSFFFYLISFSSKLQKF